MVVTGGVILCFAGYLPPLNGANNIRGSALLNSKVKATVDMHGLACNVVGFWKTEVVDHACYFTDVTHTIDVRLRPHRRPLPGRFWAFGIYVARRDYVTGDIEGCELNGESPGQAN